MESDPVGDNSSKLTFAKWRNTARNKPRPIALRYDPNTYLVNKAATADLMDVLDDLKLPDKSGGVTRQIMVLTGLHERQAKQKKADLIQMGFLVKKGSTVHRNIMDSSDI